MKRQLRLFIQCLVAAVFVLTFNGCEDDDGDSDMETNIDDTNEDNREIEDTDANATDETEEEDSDAEVSAEFTVSGVVKRSGTAAVKGDGIGTLCVAITHSCPSGNNANPEMLGTGVVIKDADFAADGATVDYSVIVKTAEAELEKKYFVSAVMKEHGGECIPAPGEPLLMAGDMVGMNCGRFVFEGTDVENVNVTLDWTLEFDI